MSAAQVEAHRVLDAAIVQPEQTIQQKVQPIAYALQWPLDSRINLSTVFDTRAEAVKYKDSCVTEYITVVPLYAASQPEQSTQLKFVIDRAWAEYERMGEVCSYEGNSMIYVSTLEEIYEASTVAQPPTVQPAKGLFVGMIESHGPDFVAGLSQQSALPAEPAKTPELLHVNPGWKSFSRTPEYQQCLKWIKNNRAPGALFSAFLAGANSAAQPQQSTPVVQQSASMPEFWRHGFDSEGRFLVVNEGDWVRLSDVAAAWPASHTPTKGTTP